jgi:sodium/potassium-transporting ATPase subunit alpha
VAYSLRAYSAENAPGDNLYLGVALAVVSMVTGGLSLFQDLKASKIMDSFEVLLPQAVGTLRDGQKKWIPSQLLVPGDIIELSSGDIIPADIRILSAHCLKVDEAVLTGESRPVPKGHLQSSSNPLEAKNLAFCGAYVVEGSAQAMVIGTGCNTLLARISGQSSRAASSKEAFITLEMRHFFRSMVIFAVATGVVFFCFAVAIGYHWLDAVVFLVGTIVAMVPEGLIITVGVSLALTAQRMAAKNCLIKNLGSIS